MKTQERQHLLQTLQSRFEKNMQRHQGVGWQTVQARLDGHPAAMESLLEMETSGGEPDVIGQIDGEGVSTF